MSLLKCTATSEVDHQTGPIQILLLTSFVWTSQLLSTVLSAMRLEGDITLDKKLDLLRLNSMRKYVANTKHYICAHIYIDVNIQYIYANICNIFTAYVKVTTYLPTYVHYICDGCKYIICLPTSLQHVCYLKAL